MTQEQTVFIVDDDPAVLDSLQMLIKSAGLNSRSFHCAKSFLDFYQPTLAGCLILDVRMPQLSGLELQRLLNQEEANLPVIFITGHGDVPMAVQAMKNGALEFLQKPFRDQELLDHVHRALETNKRSRQARKQLEDIRRRVDSLTKRERQVMKKMVAGEINKVIANELGVSPRTVEIHRAKVMEKMRVKTLAQLVQLVVQI